jgi:site-specific DNA-methyltransferase (adenine-specific)
MKEFKGRSTIKIYNGDCMEYMKDMKDNQFDLAIVDPPYGLGIAGTLGKASKKTKGFNFKAKEYKKKEWDNETPKQEYFDELKRVSKNQIIWGANYFTDKIPIIKNYIFWYKKGLSNDSKFNEGELAYISTGRTRMVDIWWNGFGVINSGEKRHHPTQKPVKLYEWILDNYAKEGDKILDTHLGSGSIAIACWDLGFDLTAFEIDKDYFNDACNRTELHTRQEQMYPPDEIKQPEQTNLF